MKIGNEYQNILVAINIYEDFHHVLHTAEKLAQKHHASLTIMMALNAPLELIPMANEYQKSLEEEVSQKLTEEAEKLNVSKLKTVTHTGSSHGEIIKYAKSNPIDLIVLGSHGNHGLNLLLGSTSNSVLHQSPCDVLTVRLGKGKPVSASHYNNILLATDLEAESYKLANKAKSFAQHYEGKIHTLKVQADPTIAVSTYGIIPDMHHELKENAEKQLAAWCQSYDLGDHYSCITGEATYEITKKAEDNQHNLIILGSHQRSAIGRFFLGSTANAVLHHADTDVLVVRLK